MADKTRKQHFEDVVASVIGRIGHSLPPDQARINVQKAYRKIADSHEWYHQNRKGYVIAPKGYSGGGQGTFTSGARLVVVDAAVQTYLDAVNLVDLRSVGVLGPDGRMYEVQQWFSSTLKLVLAQPYLGDSVTGAFVAKCQFVRLPYKPVDFEATNDSVEVGDTTGWLIDDTFRNIVSLRSLDDIVKVKYTPQPQRLRRIVDNGLGNFCYELTPAFTAGSEQYFELYPEYTASDKHLVFECVYSTTGGEFHEDLSEAAAKTPIAFSSELIETYASYLCCLWVEANKTAMPVFKTSNWLQLAATYLANYQQLFFEAVRRDRELHSLASQQDLYGHLSSSIVNSPDSLDVFDHAFGLTVDGRVYS